MAIIHHTCPFLRLNLRLPGEIFFLHFTRRNYGHRTLHLKVVGRFLDQKVRAVASGLRNLKTLPPFSKTRRLERREAFPCEDTTAHGRPDKE